MFLLCLPYYPSNSTSTFTTTALFLSLFRVLDWDQLKLNQSLANAFVIALITSAICTLKSSVIPACTIFFLSSYIFYLLGAKSNRHKIIYEFLLSVIFVFIFLSPWMISMYQSSGTLLYPLLGKGYHSSIYSNENYNFNQLIIDNIFKVLHLATRQTYFICLFVLGILSFMERAPWKIRGREALFSLWIGSLAGAILIALAVGEGPGFNRYPLPFANAAIICMLANGLVNKNSKEINKFWSYSYQLFTILFIIITIVLAQHNYSIHSKPLGKTISQMKLDVKNGLNNISLISKQEILDYRTIQKSIPEGETILARVDKPFLLDFKRNTIFIADWPGEVSPPPGIPSFQGSETLADYLLSHQIRYLVYSYGNEG